MWLGLGWYFLNFRDIFIGNPPRAAGYSLAFFYDIFFSDK